MTMNIQDIIKAIQRKQMRISDHADEEAQADHLPFDEIFFSVLQGETLEEYPTDKPYPSCLIYGDSLEGNRYTLFGHIIPQHSGLY